MVVDSQSVSRVLNFSKLNFVVSVFRYNNIVPNKNLIQGSAQNIFEIFTTLNEMSM